MRQRPALLGSLTALLVVSIAVPALGRDPMIIGASTPSGRSAAVVQDRIAAFTAAVGGHRPATWSLWSQWGSRGGHAACLPDAGSCSFPSEGVAWLHGEDITPVVWWEPINPDKSFKGKFERYKRILGGQHDAYIREWAQDARDAGQAAGGRRIILRFAHEANGYWFPWGIGRFDNTADNFKKAWRYVWRIFKAEGALPYVDFLWSVTKQNCPSCNPFAKVYPGAKYVDYAGVTAFNWGSWRRRGWKSLPRILQSPVRDMMRVTGKPIIISETASHWKGGDKAAWIRNGYEAVYKRWPRIKALLYLDTDEPHREAGHPDWSLSKPANGSAEDAYGQTAAKARFQGQFQ
jgi:hypothetical protein